MLIEACEPNRLRKDHGDHAGHESVRRLSGQCGDVGDKIH